MLEPPGWAKYVQLRLLTHYGSEPVCALNDVRVNGKSAAEDLEDRLAMEVRALYKPDCMLFNMVPQQTIFDHVG